MLPLVALHVREEDDDMLVGPLTGFRLTRFDATIETDL
jgi:hypothetical protein